MTRDVEFTPEHHENMLRSGGVGGWVQALRGFGSCGVGGWVRGLRGFRVVGGWACRVVWWCGVVVLLVGFSLAVTPPRRWELEVLRVQGARLRVHLPGG